jgi:hypothetical protein
MTADPVRLVILRSHQSGHNDTHTTLSVNPANIGTVEVAEHTDDLVERDLVLRTVQVGNGHTTA